MPVSFTIESEEVVLWKQQFQSPTVYLDTWAIRFLAEDEGLASRFSGALKNAGGTWLFAPLTVGEFARFEDPRHAAAADALLSKVVPNIYLCTTEPIEVLVADQVDEALGPPVPKAHEPIMINFARRFQSSGSVEQALSGMFMQAYQGRALMRAVVDEAGVSTAQALTRLRQSGRNRARWKAAFPDGVRSRSKIILGELIRDVVLDQNAQIRANDALDLMHAVHAVNYCDLILLDAAWERRVNSLRSRIEEHGSHMRVAHCYSQRNNGVETFIGALEAYESNSPNRNSVG